MGRILKLIQIKLTPKALIIAPLWPGQPWFSTLVKMSITQPNTLTSTSGPIEKSHGGIASTLKESHTSTSGLSSVRKQLEQKGISIAASETML